MFITRAVLYSFPPLLCFQRSGKEEDEMEMLQEESSQTGEEEQVANIPDNSTIDPENAQEKVQPKTKSGQTRNESEKG